MKVLEIASLSKEVIEELGKCIFLVKGDRSIEPAIGYYEKEAKVIHSADDQTHRLGWFSHLMPVESLHE
jgi:hypothetical protein